MRNDCSEKRPVNDLPLNPGNDNVESSAASEAAAMIRVAHSGISLCFPNGSLSMLTIKHASSDVEWNLW